MVAEGAAEEGANNKTGSEDEFVDGHQGVALGAAGGAVVKMGAITDIPEPLRADIDRQELNITLITVRSMHGQDYISRFLEVVIIDSGQHRGLIMLM